MAVKVLCLWLLLHLFCLSQSNEQTCLKSVSSCNKCLQSDSACAWCSSPQANIRCSTLNGLQRTGCPKRFIYNPVGSMQVGKNNSRTDSADIRTVFLQPQEVFLHQRPGVSQSFHLNISTPTDQPEITLDLRGVPDGVKITFINMKKGNPQLLQVNVEAAQCPSESDSSEQNRTGPWSVFITPRGFSLSVKLEITLLCQCNCTGNREENSPNCSSHGALVCGHCECYEPYFGQHCHLNSDSFLSQDESLCRSSSKAPVCSGRGNCVEGFCECNVREEPEKKYYGQYCECSNFNCPYYNNRHCGGNGKCECGSCVCDPDWMGEACSCSMDTNSCMATNQMLCNGRGVCECGSCRCEPPFKGGTCEECPVCPNIARLGHEIN